MEEQVKLLNEIEELKSKCFELTGRIQELQNQRNTAQDRAVILVGVLAKTQRQLEEYTRSGVKNG